jgi:hypothetical protein
MKQLLKSLGFSNVKQSVSGDSYKTPTYRNQSGKMVFGLRGGSVGPLTVTNAHLERNRDVQTKLIAALRSAGATVSETRDFIEVTANGKHVSLFWTTYPSYTNLRDYQSYVLTSNVL